MPINIGEPSPRRHVRLPAHILSIGLLVIILGASLWAIFEVAAHHNDKLSPTPVAKLTGTPTLVNAGTTPTPRGNLPRARYRPPSGTDQGGVQASTAGGATGSGAAAGAVQKGSAMLFGTNLSLYDTSDQVLTSAATRTLLQQMHLHIVRFPLRSTLTDATIVQVAQIIKSIGAAPLLILRTADTDTSSTADDTKAIKDIQSVFGSATTYYEYGNEEDLTTTVATQYIAAWNKDIPQFKKVAPNAQFIGPANYHYDPTYLKAFLQGAKPRPDMVSWHEYTCALSWTTAQCLSHIDNWKAHAVDARVIMSATLGTTLPIMITEWNYTPDQKAKIDGKTTDTAFMTAWTTKAFQTLAASGIYASMEYACTGSALNLVASNGTITTQGTVFQKLYAQMVQ